MPRKKNIYYIDFYFYDILCHGIEVSQTGLNDFNITSKGFEKLIKELLLYGFNNNLTPAIVAEAIIVKTKRATTYIYINDPNKSYKYRLLIAQRNEINKLLAINNINTYVTTLNEKISFDSVLLTIKYVDYRNKIFATGNKAYGDTPYDWNEKYPDLKMDNTLWKGLQSNAQSTNPTAPVSIPTAPQVQIKDIQSAVSVLQIAYRMNPNPDIKLKIELYQMTINSMLRTQAAGTTTQTGGKIIFDEPKFQDINTIEPSLVHEYKELRDKMNPIDIIKSYEKASSINPYVNVDIIYGTQKIMNVYLQYILDGIDNYGYVIPNPIPRLANEKEYPPGTEKELDKTNIVYIIRCQSDPKKIIELYETYTAKDGSYYDIDKEQRITMKLETVLSFMRNYPQNP